MFSLASGIIEEMHIEQMDGLNLLIKISIDGGKSLCKIGMQILPNGHYGESKQSPVYVLAASDVKG